MAEGGLFGNLFLLWCYLFGWNVFTVFNGKESHTSTATNSSSSSSSYGQFLVKQNADSVNVFTTCHSIEIWTIITMRPNTIVIDHRHHHNHLWVSAPTSVKLCWGMFTYVCVCVLSSCACYRPPINSVPWGGPPSPYTSLKHTQLLAAPMTVAMTVVVVVLLIGSSLCLCCSYCSRHLMNLKRTLIIIRMENVVISTHTAKKKYNETSMRWL